MDVERWFYDTLTPSLIQIRNKHGLAPLKQPKVFYTDETGTIIMENLKDQGFGLVKKTPLGRI